MLHAHFVTALMGKQSLNFGCVAATVLTEGGYAPKFLDPVPSTLKRLHVAHVCCRVRVERRAREGCNHWYTTCEQFASDEELYNEWWWRHSVNWQ